MWDRARMPFRERFPRAAMRAAPALPTAALLAGSLLGCGHSGAAPSGATTTQGTSPVARTSTSGSSLKAIGTPKFATPSKSQPVQRGTAQIAYRNVTAQPVTLRVEAGTTVRFTNYDPIEHNATSVGGTAGTQQFHSKNFGEGESFEVKLTHPGLVHFECTIHPVTINGTIEVL
jgi:plastocyanin